MKIDFENILLHLKRRRPNSSGLTTERVEEDEPQVLSGLSSGFTTGAPLCAVFRNKDVRSEEYSKLIFRPGHADFTAFLRYKGFSDLRGGGHLSGRLTCPLVFAGSVCRQILMSKGIQIGSHVSSVGCVSDDHFDRAGVNIDILKRLSKESFPTINESKKEEMKKEIFKAKAEGDSIGGVVECAIVGIPAGIGGPIFEGIESKISSLVFSVPAVKGVEFGSGFAGSNMKGSENNDEFALVGGKIQTLTNNHGGVLGGISSGMPIIFRAAFKPTPSIARPQKTVDFDGLPQEISLKGRHDPCIAVRAAVAVESAAAISILDLVAAQKEF